MVRLRASLMPLALEIKESDQMMNSWKDVLVDIPGPGLDGHRQGPHPPVQLAVDVEEVGVSDAHWIVDAHVHLEIVIELSFRLNKLKFTGTFSRI